MRVVVLSMIVCAVVVWTVPADAACFAGGTNRKEQVAQLPDLNFTYGFTATQGLTPIYANMDASGQPYVSYPYNNCRVYARSNVPGITVQDAYGDGIWQPTGQWGAIDNEWAPSNSWSHMYPNFTDGSSNYYVRYDGTSPATAGYIDIAVNENGGDGDLILRLIAHVNVYIKTSPPTTWYVPTSDAGNIWLSTRFSGSILASDA